MGWIVRFAKSSIGAKMVMALTGLALFGFVVAHMIGNLQLFMGREALNAYAALLKSQAGLLWVMRLGIIAAVILHILSGIRLSTLNKQARPVAYAVKNWRRASPSSRTMIWTGLMVLAFIVYHLLHFTLGVTNPDHFALRDAQGRHDVYGMVIAGFQNVWVTGSYVLAMLMLGPHLSHGASSMFQSLGLRHPQYDSMISKIGPTFAAVIVIGNITMPLAVLFGYR
jgi:succinate dehydrogenase / fumarate reductase cytochrome b subunit